MNQNSLGHIYVGQKNQVQNIFFELLITGFQKSVSFFTSITLTILLASLMLWDTSSASPHRAVSGAQSWRAPRGG